MAKYSIYRIPNGDWRPEKTPIKVYEAADMNALRKKILAEYTRNGKAVKTIKMEIYCGRVWRGNIELQAGSSFLHFISNSGFGYNMNPSTGAIKAYWSRADGKGGY